MEKFIIKDVFLDLDHTLWDFDKNSKCTFKKIFSINKIDINFELFLETYLPINMAYWKLYRENKISKDRLRFARLNDVFIKLNINISSALIYKLSDDYINYLSSFNFLIKDAKHLLDYLNSKYTLHIITNGFEEVQSQKLINSNISKYFSSITNSEMVGVKKPHPKIFSVALEKANAKIESSIMIGDNIEADVIGAIKFGMDAILFNYHKTDVPRNIISIDNLIDLKQYL